MTLVDIKKLLPDPDRQEYESLKTEHPFNVLSKYGNAIGEKYSGKLNGIATESADITSERLISYAFYIVAAIGKGYSYRLLELTPTSIYTYPLKVTLFENYPQELKVVNNYLELENTINSIIQMGFTKTLFLNLLAQIDLYNESRDGGFE